MIRRLIILLLTCCPSSAWAACTGSSPTWTSTPDRTSVATCVTNASRRDTINVSAGSATWSSVITLSKGVTIAGAGVGNVILTSSGGATFFAIAPDSTAIANEENIKITGFTFDGAATTATYISLQGASGITGTKPYRYIIIGNNKFQNQVTNSSNGVFEAFANGNGQLRGVIYNNTFDRCNIIIRPFSNNDTSEWANTIFNQFTFGSSDNLYFEHNTIQFSTSYAGDNPGWMESGQGGRIVSRFNTWNLANATTPQEVWDVHGFQNWNGIINSGQTGTMLVEYYDNNLSNMGTFRWINHRGSWGMFFDNTLTGSGGNSIEINQYFLGVPSGSGCPAQINPTPTNYNPIVNNTYTFNNLLNGARNNMVPGPIGNGCGTAENVTWWNQQTSFNGTVGIGRGTKASMPGTCTTGVGFWVTNEGSWNTNLAANTSGQFYKCVSTNTWQLYYTPYTYPHPLSVSGSPAVSLNPTSLTFSNQLPGVASVVQTITLTNTGTGLLTITSVSLAGTNPGDFSETTTCTGTITAGANCVINVTFLPTTTGARVATVSIVDSASGSPHTASLAGFGLSKIIVGPASISGNATIKTGP